MTVARAFIHASEFPAAAPFYAIHPTEPIVSAGALKVIASTKLTRMTAVDLLQSMVQQRKKLEGGNVLIVGHGTDQGMSMPLAPGSASRLQNNALGVLFKNESRGVADAQAARQLFVSPATLQRLKVLAATVRALGLQRVEARACTVGAEQATLENLRRFFGARVFGGPKVFDVFGGFPRQRPGSAKAFEKWYQDRGAKVEGPPGKRIAFTLFDDGRIREFAVESADALRIWAAAKFPTGQPKPRGAVHYHALLENWQPVFPNEPRFRQLLAHA